MKLGPSRVGERSPQAFSTFDLLAVVACIGAVAALLILPALAKSRGTSSRLSCVNRLKQVGSAFRCWSLDNNDLFPMQVSVTNGGSLESVVSGTVVPHLQVMSNDLMTPKILVCPMDFTRVHATNFSTDFRERNLSYFLAMEAKSGDGTSLLSGDRNLTNQVEPGRRLVVLRPGESLGWNREMHSGKGNLAFGDGRVDAWSNSTVRAVLRIPSGSTNHLAVP